MEHLNIPAEFKFMGRTWQVKPGTVQELGTDLGQCRQDEYTIYLSPGYPDQRVIATLFHELVHVWETELNLHLTEDQVDSISVAMTHWFKENPEFIPLLVDDLEFEQQ